ncbi:MAG: TylF/MycF/NovP-related O-methyltransferase [Rhizobiaceae bacterium]
MARAHKPARTGFLQHVYGAGRRLAYAFFRADMRHSEVEHRREFMRRAFHALAFNGISGDYVEFGSHGGTTFALAHDEIIRWKKPRLMWACDSFAGLPEQKGDVDFHPGWKKGKMATSLEDFVELCRRNGIPDLAYRAVAGFYDRTLAGKAADDPELPHDIALAYVDCDLHSSTTIVLEFLRPRLKHGMIIAFDDYFCFSDRTISGERKAFLDCFGDDGRFSFLPYVQFGWHGMSFIVEDRQLLPPA